MLLRESMGVGADSSNKAFHATDITAFLERKPVEIYRDHVYYDDRANTNHVLIAVDPSGGGSSAFAICSMAQLPNGSVVVRGQFPSFSPPHISDSTTAMRTYASGAWHECWRNLGSMNGSTRSVRSRVCCSSCCAKCFLSSGSRCSANSKTALLQQTCGPPADILAMSHTSTRA